MKRCTLVIPDAGPFNSLWVADQLQLLLQLDMIIIVIDAIYDELTSDLTYPKDRDVKDFIDRNQPPIIVETTSTGQNARELRRSGAMPKRNTGEIAIADFMTSEDGLARHLAPGDPVLILFEDSGFRVFSKPPNMHLLSTVGMLRGLERVGIVKSANEIIKEMTHPSKPLRRNTDARALNDLPSGVDEEAKTFSTWTPTQYGLDR